MTIYSGGVAVSVQSVAGRTGAVTLTKADVGLSSADDTSDASKPVSAAQRSAILAAKQVPGIFGLPSAAARNNFLVGTFDHDAFGGASTGTLSATYRNRHLILKDTYEIRALWCNYDGASNGPQDITVKIGIELSTGEIIPAYFDGKRSVVVEPGGYCLTDPIAIDQAAGALIYSRLFHSVPSGKWKITNSHVTVNTDYSVDRTAAGAFVAGGGYGTLPAAIFGTDSSAQQIVGFGDSITFGTGDSQEPTNGLGGGFMARAMGSTIPFLNLGFPGEYADDMNDGARRAKRWAFIGSASKALTMYGTNDWHFGGNTAAQIEANMLALGTRLLRRGLPVYVCTIPPITSSTDSWATTGNQTPFTGYLTVRAAYNAWLRAGAPIDPTTKAAVAVGTSGALLCDAYNAAGAKVITGTSALHPFAATFDTGSQVETALDSGIWLVGRTGDGVHPTGTGHTNMAAGIVTAALA